MACLCPNSITICPRTRSPRSRCRIAPPPGSFAGHYGGNGSLRDLQFRDFPELLRPDDLVVFNNTRVFPARLYGHRGGLRAQPVSPHNPAAREFLHGRIEVLLTRQLSENPNEWECLVRPGRKVGVGERIFFREPSELVAEVVGRGEFGERCIRFAQVDNFFQLLDKLGHVPLPPYVSRSDTPLDHERYQTVYARERGSVAAPTAGLHFTPEILDRLRQRGIQLPGRDSAARDRYVSIAF